MNTSTLVVLTIVVLLRGVSAPCEAAATQNVPKTNSTASKAANSLDDATADEIVKRTYFRYRCPIAVGVITPRGSKIICFGKDRGGRPVTPTTEFETASISKIFTGLLLAQACERGEVALDQPVREAVPLPVPDFDGEPITFRELATHMSGLPDWPTNRGSTTSPYSTAALEQYLRCAQRSGYPGDMTYSNAGFALLGHALARRANTSFESLMVQRICNPLGMKDTRVTLTRDMSNRLARGHNAAGLSMASSSPTAGGGADGVRSTVQDMLKLVGAYAGIVPTTFPGALRLSSAVHETINDQDDIGLGWYVRKPSGIIWKGGNIAGYRSYIGFQPQSRIGIVLLTGNNALPAPPLGEAILSHFINHQCQSQPVQSNAALPAGSSAAIRTSPVLCNATLRTSPVWSNTTLRTSPVWSNTTLRTSLAQSKVIR